MDSLEALIWLDAHVNANADNKQAQQELRSIFNNFKPFENQTQCQTYIRSVPSHNRIILIVSGQFGRQLVPDIHQLHQLSSIYIYCMNKQINEEWSKDYSKVRSFFFDLILLVLFSR